MSPGDPLDLLKGISDMFVSYEPNFGFENTLDFCDSHKSNTENFDFANFCYIEGWDLLSQSILNKFAPRHSIFLQELQKKKEENQKEIDEKKQKADEKRRLRLILQNQRKQAMIKRKNQSKDFFGYISTEKHIQK